MVKAISFNQYLSCNFPGAGQIICSNPDIGANNVGVLFYVFSMVAT
jgi:hypothetical protein